MLLVITSEKSFTAYNDYVDWLTTNAPSSTDITTDLSCGIKNVGECALTAGASLTPYAQQLANTWSNLPRESQQVILGGAVLAAAAYHSPKLYHYLLGTVESEKQRIIARATQGNSIFPGISLNRVPQGNLYNQVLSYFKFHQQQQAPLSNLRSDLFFFKYVKTALEDEIYAIKYNIQQKVLNKNLSKTGIFFQKFWTTDNDLKELNELTSQHSLLTKIIAQLEKEISNQLSY
jgi:hypothetical protein